MDTEKRAWQVWWVKAILFAVAAVAVVVVNIPSRSRGGQVFIVRCFYMLIAVWFILANIFFSRKKLYHTLFRFRYLIGVLIVITGVVLNVNGSSLAVWAKYLHIPETRTAFGQAREFRSDEWAVMTPMIFSQRYGAHPYGWENMLLRADATDVVMVYGLPVRSWIMVFRPFLIGFMLFGSTRGLAFFWWARSVCLCLVSFEMFRVITKDRRPLSAAGAALMLFSPMMEWWFAICGLVEMFVFGFLFLLSLRQYLRSRAFLPRLGCLIVMGISAGGYEMTMYPAWMVPVAYVMLALMIWIIGENFTKGCLRKRDVLMLALCIAATGAALGYIFLRSLSVIRTVTGTVYPGKRSETGGKALSMFWYPASMFFWYKDKGMISNPSESSVFLSFFPVGLVYSLVILIKQKIKKQKPDLLLLTSLIMTLFLMWYCVLGFPEILAKVTLLSNSPSNRAQIGTGVLQIILLMRSLALTERREKVHAGWIVFSAVLAVFYAVSAVTVSAMEQPGYMTFGMKTVAVILLFMACLGILSVRYTDIPAAYILTAIALISGALVNPLQIGDAGVLESSDSKKIQAVVEQDPDAVWASCNGVGFPYNNYLIMNGARTITTTNTYPDLKRWEALDRGVKEEDKYNRYAHVSFNVTADGAVDDSQQFMVATPDSFYVSLTDEDLLSMGVQYLYSFSDMTALSDSHVTYKKIEQLDVGTIYKVVPR